MRRKKTKQVKPKRAKIARDCVCTPKRPTFPLNDHGMVCPVKRIYNTTNGRIIADMLFSEKMKGNPRNYVVLSGSSLLDYNGTYEINLDDGYKLRFSGVLLVHKRKLHHFIGDAEAGRFWRRGLGRSQGPNPKAQNSGT